jgi:hypothetical protein
MSVHDITKPGNDKVLRELANIKAEAWRGRFIDTRKEIYDHIKKAKYSEYKHNLIFENSHKLESWRVGFWLGVGFWCDYVVFRFRVGFSC